MKKSGCLFVDAEIFKISSQHVLLIHPDPQIHVNPDNQDLLQIHHNMREKSKLKENKTNTSNVSAVIPI